MSSPAERFMTLVEPEPNTGCWLWTRSLRPGCGYGQLKEGGRMRFAHRVAYELFVGPIGHGLYVCHRCDVKVCVNPDHLFLGTPKDNAQDMIRKGRQHYQQKRSHCLKGHELTPDNVYEYADTRRAVVRRACRICMRNTALRWRTVHPNWRTKAA
jgi:hypothetical protein